MRPASLIPTFALLSGLSTCSTAVPQATEPKAGRVQNVVPDTAPSPIVAAVLCDAAVPTLPPSTIEGAAAAPAPRPFLEHPEALKHFFADLSALTRGLRTEDVRVLQFGDSHTAADYETGPLRRTLQRRFGDGGRGYVSLGRPWKFYVQEGVKGNGMTGWTSERGHFPKGNFVGDGRYGLVGVSIATSKRGAYAYTDLTASTSSIELDFLASPNGGSFEVEVDGASVKHVHTHGAETKASYVALDVAEGPHRVGLIASGDGPVRVFGATLDSSTVGVTFDALGVNGARARDLLRLDEEHFMAELSHRAPSLVVLAYGTNESGDDTPLEQYEQQVASVVGRVTRALPHASCLLLGPPDRAERHRVVLEAGALPGSGRSDVVWTTIPRMLDVVAMERRVAIAAGCAYYSQLDAMGGPGAIAEWAELSPPKALRDRTHLTRTGYAELGAGVAHDLLEAYDAYFRLSVAP